MILYNTIPKIRNYADKRGIRIDGSKRAREQARADRKMMLQGFGKMGISYLWLYYTWYGRGAVRRYAKKLGLYK